MPAHLSSVTLNLILELTNYGSWRGGVQFGFAQRDIDYSDLHFPEENESLLSETYLGVLKTMDLSYDKSLQLGMAHYHLNNLKLYLLYRKCRSFTDTSSITC